MRKFTFAFLAMALPLAAQAEPAAAWQPKSPRLLTPWTKQVDPLAPHPEYPRPQLVRAAWQNLNGLWDFAIAPSADTPPSYGGKILVPYPIESALSGVAMALQPSQRAWYRRSFSVPSAWRGQRVWLRFGAVDWACEARVNGKSVGTHQGGYDPFAFDVTEALAPGDAAQELVVTVTDPTDSSTQPRGKQVRTPGGIWYTPTSGIWQTVWLEPVPVDGLARLRLTPRVQPASIEIAAPGAAAKLTLHAEVGAPAPAGTSAEGPADQPLRIAVPQPKLWTPDQPHLYPLRVTLRDGERVVDTVESYFGLREIAIAKDDAGINRLMLNGTPLFQLGLLDQGFWPDGLYTPPTDAALRYDLDVTKQLGFNLVRKHVKVEAATFYAHCDRLGLLVWQDMPSGDKYIGSRDPDVQRTAESAAQFERELGAIMDALQTHPCIVMWVPFNEGWGQFDTARIAQWVKDRDPTRLVNSASGWTDREVGDVHDIHVYPGPATPRAEPTRAAVLGEFGGLGLPIAEHTWQDKENWGYRSFDTPQALQAAYVDLIGELRLLIAEGLCAAVYTQTTDVEIEVNGLLSYDRKILKVDGERVRAANLAVHRPAPDVTVLAPTAQQSDVTWRYTTAAPPPEWTKPEFDDAAWREGVGGFGTKGTPSARIGTVWDGKEIWLRRALELPKDFDPATLHLLVHHDEDAVIWVNGIEVLKLPGYRTSYRTVKLSDGARAAFRPGRNVLSVHCRQTGGGQFIDVGVAAVREK